MKWITWILLSTLVFLQYQIWLHEGGLRNEYKDKQQKAEIIHQQNQDLRRQNDILRAELFDLKNGYEVLSEIARTERGYIERGELFYNLKPDHE